MSKGLTDAGFKVIGIDNKPQPRYPFVFKLSEWDAVDLRAADYIHASPPCQHYSDLAHRNGNADDHPDLIEPVRLYLQDFNAPYTIENVEGAPLIDPVILCGVWFPGLRVIRHRLFESNLPLVQPEHLPHPLCYTMDRRKRHYSMLDEWRDYVSVNGGGNCSVAAARDAMGIPWMTKAELNEAIPPKYAEFIGRQIYAALAA